MSRKSRIFCRKSAKSIERQGTLQGFQGTWTQTLCSHWITDTARQFRKTEQGTLRDFHSHFGTFAIIAFSTGNPFPAQALAQKTNYFEKMLSHFCELR